MPAKPYLDQAEAAYRRGRAALIKAEGLGCHPLAVDSLERARVAAVRVRTLAFKGRTQDPKRYAQALKASDALISQYHHVRDACER